MTPLVDELLLLARADSDAVELRSDRLDLTDETGDALAGFARSPRSAGVQLALDVASRRPSTATPIGSGSSWASWSTTPSATPRGRPCGTVARDGTGARVGVDDEGPGIRPEDLPRVFDRFWRAEDAPDGGSGLGLAIARWIAERHHGRLSAANATGGGAVFTLSLPAA